MTVAKPHRLSRLRRSVHFIPGGSDKFLAKALSSGADTIVIDLEDSVPPNLDEKNKARAKTSGWLGSTRDASNNGASTPEILVRVNPMDCPLDAKNAAGSKPLWQQDIDETVRFVDGYMCPKVNSAKDIHAIAQYISEAEGQHGIPAEKKRVLIPIATETPEGVLNLGEIAKADPLRVAALTWGCEDLSAELGSLGNRNEAGYLPVFQHCRTMCLLAAKAGDVQAIDGIFANVRDAKGCQEEAKEANFSGFDGKLTLHPNQVTAVHKGFAPSAAEVKEAEEIVAAFAAPGAADKGALTDSKGRMIDLPHLKRAEKILGRVQNSGGAAAESEKEKKPEWQRVYHGKYLEELEPGTVVHHALTRTVTESDNVMFTCLSMNTAPIHLDHELSAGTEFGKPLFNSMFTLALVVGMSVLETTHGTTIANLGFSHVSFPKPVFPGDTLRAETHILDRRESKSRPTQGIVEMEHRMYNVKTGDLVCKCVRQALMKKKPVAKM